MRKKAMNACIPLMTCITFMTLMLFGVSRETSIPYAEILAPEELCHAQGTPAPNWPRVCLEGGQARR